MLYLDTSALLKLYLREEGSEAVQSQVASQDLPLPVWEIQEMELINALRLKVFWNEISASDAEGQVNLFKERRTRGLYFFPKIHRSDLMQTFRRLSEETMRLGCRTMGILHVACAVELKASAFLTFDNRQAVLATTAGHVVPALR